MKFSPYGWGLPKPETVNVNGMTGLVALLKESHPKFGPPFDPNKVCIKPYAGEDAGRGWKETAIVTMGEWGVVGFADLSNSDES